MSLEWVLGKISRVKFVYAHFEHSDKLKIFQLQIRFDMILLFVCQICHVNCETEN